MLTTILFVLLLLPERPESTTGVAFLQAQARRILTGCQTVAYNNVTLFTPDGSNHYNAQYTRDFYYALSGTPASFWTKEQATAAINYTFNRQRVSDGLVPDKVAANGQTGWAPGAIDEPMTDHAWDNGAFGALLLTELTSKWPSKATFCALEPKAFRGLHFLNLSSPNGLVYNDPISPNCTYGFTDNIAKTGSLLFTSLLLYDATRAMATYTHQYGCGNGTWYEHTAEQISKHLDTTFYDERSGLWDAATLDNSMPDIWGSFYVVALQLSTSDRRQRAMGLLLNDASLDCACCSTAPRNGSSSSIYVYGQVRHLPSGCYWERCINDNCPPRGTYQNGAYWATPLVYLAKAAVNEKNSTFVQLAKNIVNATVTFYQNGLPGFMASPAINEAINPAIPYAGAADYVASVTNGLKAVTLLVEQ